MRREEEEEYKGLQRNTREKANSNTPVGLDDAVCGDYINREGGGGGGGGGGERGGETCLLTRLRRGWVLGRGVGAGLFALVYYSSK